MTGCNLKKEPVEVLQEAKTNTQNLTAIKQKVTTQTNGVIDGIENVEAIVTYEFDKNQGFVEMKNEDQTVAMFISKDKLYLKDGTSEKYVDLSESTIADMMLMTLNFAELNENYKTLNKEIFNSIKPENLTMEKAEITLNGKNEKVQKVAFTIPKEEASKILSKYMKAIVEQVAGGMVDQLAEFQVTMEESITGEKANEEKKDKVREELKTTMEKEIQTQMEAVKFSDIKEVFYIKDDLIIKQEEMYSITENEETANVKNIIEIVEYGENVKCPEIPKENIISFEEYLNFDSEETK